MKYECSITYHSKVTANVKVYADKQTGQKPNAPNLSMGIKKLILVYVTIVSRQNTK